MEMKPSIIRGTDLKDNFENLPQFGDVALCQSLCAAQALLREYNRFFAQLTLQTADDERCSLPAAASINNPLYFKMS